VLNTNSQYIAVALKQSTELSICH